LTLIVKTFLFSPVSVVIPPLKNAEALTGAHGFSKEDWTTLCVGGKKWNSTLSPMAAVRLSGLKASLLLAPTVTLWIVVDESAFVGVESDELPYCARVRGRRARTSWKVGYCMIDQRRLCPG